VLGALFDAGRGSARETGPGGRSNPDAAATSAWPAGRYVFALRAPAWERWWSVDVAAADRGLPGGAPPGDPAAPGQASP
jgi:hypothetical protein